jgi:hypothetical protein
LGTTVFQINKIFPPKPNFAQNKMSKAFGQNALPIE